MDESRLGTTASRVRPAITARRPVLPSWLLSMALHTAIFVILALTLRPAPRQGVSAERTAEVGIALKHQDGRHEYYESQDNSGQTNATASASASGNVSLAKLLNNQPPIDTSDVLPSTLGIIGPSVVEPGGPVNPGPPAGGHPGSGNSLGGKTSVSVFGTTGEGYKFVYVFDRSASMGGSGRSPLGAAKAQLIGSLESLDTNHQFQIIFYNEKPSVFNPAGQAGKLAWATEQNKERARRFVGSITAAGGTDHEIALKRAINMQPDVIFFLTDADQPQLSAGQLYEIHRRAAGITVNAIEFGLGPKSTGNNFLVKLARQNGGQYAYKDISRLVPAGR